MELIELDATAQRALELLTNAGMSDGSIYDYTHTGFGSILRHFHTKGILYATAEMLDNFLLEQRALLDQGDSACSERSSISRPFLICATAIWSATRFRSGLC